MIYCLEREGGRRRNRERERACNSLNGDLRLWQPVRCVMLLNSVERKFDRLDSSYLKCIQFDINLMHQFNLYDTT